MNQAFKNRNSALGKWYFYFLFVSGFFSHLKMLFRFASVKIVNVNDQRTQHKHSHMPHSLYGGARHISVNYLFSNSIKIRFELFRFIVWFMVEVELISTRPWFAMNRTELRIICFWSLFNSLGMNDNSSIFITFMLRPVITTPKFMHYPPINITKI